MHRTSGSGRLQNPPPGSRRAVRETGRPQSGESKSAGAAGGQFVSQRERLLLGLGALVIVVATVVAYWPVFSAGLIWDDDAYVTRNPMLKEPDGWWRLWFLAHMQSQYFPLVFSTLRLEYAMWGLNPLGYHAVNVALHIVNSLLAWALLRRLAVPGAWLAAAIFALHPVQVETVAWVTELKNTESTMFYFLALLAWLRFCGGQGWKYYALALGMQALALFAKTTACTLPAVMLLVLWVRKERVDRRRVGQTLPFLILGIGMGLVSVWWEKHLGNYAPGLQLLGGPLDRLLIATHAVWFYVGKVFWPVQLTFSYPRWAIHAWDWRQYGWLMGCLAAAALLWSGRNKLGRGPAAAVIFFVAVLSPLLGFIPLYTFIFSYVADHYQYLACLGLIALAVGSAAQVAQAWPWTRRGLIGLAVVLVFVLAAATWRQCGIYHDVETLWADTAMKNPRSWLAHCSLGRTLTGRGRFAEAEEQFQIALAIMPRGEVINYEYGNLLVKAGRLEEALSRYRAALALDPKDASVHNNLGYVLQHLNRLDEAVTELQVSATINPADPQVWFNLGNVLSMEQRTNEAVTAYQRAAQLQPDSDLFRRRLQELGVGVK